MYDLVLICVYMNVCHRQLYSCVFYVTESYKYEKRTSKSWPVVTMQMFQVDNEVLKDLLLAPTSASQDLQIGDTASKGVHIQVIICLCSFHCQSSMKFVPVANVLLQVIVCDQTV